LAIGSFAADLLLFDPGRAVRSAASIRWAASSCKLEIAWL
jgi:hypothetical protein